MWTFHLYASTFSQHLHAWNAKVTRYSGACFLQYFFFRGYLQSQPLLVITSIFLLSSLWLCYSYRANGSLWSLRNVNDRHYDLVNCYGWERIFSAVRSQIMSFLIQHLLRIWMTGLLLWVTRRTGATSWAVAAYLIL